MERQRSCVFNYLNVTINQLCFREPFIYLPQDLNVPVKNGNKTGIGIHLCCDANKIINVGW